MQVNGAAARLVSEGDKVIVVSYGAYDERDLEAYAPVVVHVDDATAIVGVDSHPEVLLGSPLAVRGRRGVDERSAPTSPDTPPTSAADDAAAAGRDEAQRASRS